MLAAATKRELPLWMSVSRAFLGWCELERACDEGIEDTRGRARLPAGGARCLLAANVPELARRGVCRYGQYDGAKVCIEEARAIIGGANFWYEIECLRIEARMAGDEDQPEQLFEQALALARQRGQIGFALRAARCFADYLASKGQAERGCGLLQEALLPFVNEPDSGDRADAKTLLRTFQGRVPGLLSL